MAKTVVGMFDHFDEARAAYDELCKAGLDRKELSLVAPDPAVRTRTENEPAAPDVGTEAARGAAVGAGTGAVVGGAAGLAISLAGIGIPGIGPILVSGPIMALLSGAGVGAGVGALAGGLIGALTAAGVPEQEAVIYHESVKQGGTLLMAQCDDRFVNIVAQIMERHRAVDVQRRGEEYQQRGYLRPSTVTPSAPPQRFEGISAGEPREQGEPTMSYRTHQRPTDTVATAPVVEPGRVVHQPGQEPLPASTRTVEDDTVYREDFRTRYADIGGTFDDYQPAYRYGSMLRRDSRFKDRDWTDVEEAARKDWEQQHPGTWERFKEAIRYSWNRVP